MKMIWFDDGLSSTYDVAYPVMKKRGLTGIVAVVTGAVGKTLRNYKRNVDYPCMNREELKTLINEGWEIASHTVSHPLKFNELTPDEARYELENSKEWIIDNLGVTPTKFAFPRQFATAAQSRLARTLYPYIRPLAPGAMRYPPNIIVYHWVEAKWYEDCLMRDLRK